MKLYESVKKSGVKRHERETVWDSPESLAKAF
jgi:hypothetical protein